MPRLARCASGVRLFSCERDLLSDQLARSQRQSFFSPPPLACWRARGLGSDIDELLRSCLPLACWRARGLGSDIDELLRSCLAPLRSSFRFGLSTTAAGQTRSFSLRSSLTKPSVTRDAGHRLFSFRLIFFYRALVRCIEPAVAVAGIAAKPRQLLLCRCD